MRQDMAEGRPSLGRLLANGTMRLAREGRLSRGQALALALCLVGAVALGIAIEPRAAGPVRPAPPPDDRSSQPSSDAGGAAPTDAPPAVAVALDRLAAEAASMSERLDAAVAAERAASRIEARPAPHRLLSTMPTEPRHGASP